MKSIIVLLLVISFIYAQDCSTLKDCTTCSVDANCGWCSATQQCLPGNEVGPSGDNVKCLGGAWHFGPNTCPRCDLLRDCRQCNLHPSDCGWCASQKKCADVATFNKPGGCQKVDFCPCDTYYGCDTCLDSTHCQWCDGSSTCQTINNDCASGPGYNISVGCPCKYNTDCTSCKEAYNCQWCTNTGTCAEVGSQSDPPCMTPMGQSCNTFCTANGNTSCSACSKLNGCGWCASTKSCVDTRYGGCSMFVHSCETCSMHKYCDPCNDADGCTWCGNSKKCIKTGTEAGCMAAASCPNMCNALPSCTSCNDVPGCGWCNDGKEGKCLDSDRQPCTTGMFAHSCGTTPIIPGKTGGFDGGSYVGGMFTVIGLIVVAGAAYLFYRWKTGKKILYTELR